jgi:hypothetical protein
VISDCTPVASQKEQVIHIIMYMTEKDGQYEVKKEAREETVKEISTN